MVSRNLWGVYRNAAGEFRPVFVHFADADDGELADSYATRPEARDNAAERNRLAREERARAEGQGSLW